MRYFDKIRNILTFGKESTSGIKIDVDNPVYGWKDLVGQIIPDSAAPTRPTMYPIRGTGTHITAYGFAAGKQIDDITYHISHDHVLGTDIYIHTHWEHAGTAISGALDLTYYLTYSKGYNQAGELFEVEKVLNHVIPVTNITSHRQYAHFIDEIKCSIVGGSASMLDTNKLEVDGLIKVAVVVNSIPTITGAPAGSANVPFILMVDIHYQSNGIPTKNRNFPFYI